MTTWNTTTHPPADESWQPLTPNTVLPESGYLVLRDETGTLYLTHCKKGVSDAGWYGDAAELATDYTHYRVLRGPEET